MINTAKKHQVGSDRIVNAIGSLNYYKKIVLLLILELLQLLI